MSARHAKNALVAAANPVSRPNTRRQLLIAGLLSPALALGIAVALTFLLMAYVSVQEQFPGPASFALEHYLAFFSDSYLMEAAWRTIALGAVTTIICAVLGYPVAWYLVMLPSRYAYMVFIIILTPLLVSIVVRTIGWTVILGNEGLINAALTWLGIVEEPVPLMQSFWSVVAGMVHVLLPFMVLSISAVLSRMDKDAIEAALTLGATPRTAFRLIILPLSIHGVATGSVIVFCLTVGSYLTPLWLGRGSVPVMALTVRQQVLDLGDWPGGAVQALILAVGALGLIGLFSMAVARMARR
ncbi:ABC transporter permease [Microbaculum marinum]|uniref:ABC transporter permease n=1 Tax=Microbaculum marinum TaxID=1764581 RepID=A0AAW9RWA2_9HYPH